MRIAIDLTSLNDNFTGLERYAYMVSENMINTHPETEFILVFKGEIPRICDGWDAYPNVSVKLIANKGKLVTNQLILPREMSAIKADVCYFPAFPIPLLFNKKNSFVMVADTVCFDMPDTMKTKARLFWSAGLKHSVRVSRGISVNSRFTLSRLAKYFPGAEKKAVIGYCGVERKDFETGDESRTAAVRERYGLPGRYILSVCTIEPRKNLKLLMEAYAELKEEGHKLPSLVLVGRMGWKTEGWFDTLKEKLGEDLKITGFVEDADLPYVYKAAELFVFPSLYEGFGMPPLEALAAGVEKVLVSDLEVMKEVLGGSTEYFRSGDRDSLKEKLVWFTDGNERHRQYDAVGLEKYDWAVTAEKIYGMLTGGSR